MIDLDAWIIQFMHTLHEYFPNRIWFVGLQGSYGRGEATESSDIDMVVILDEVSPTDIQTYHTMLDTLPHRNLICGFLSGKQELLHWESSDLFQFYYDTKPIHGSLDSLLPLLDSAAVDRAIKVGVCNIYHGCVHNMLHEKSEDLLKGLYKSASFVLQAIAFRETGTYIRQQTELRKVLSTEDQVIADGYWSIKNGDVTDFQDLSARLLLWAKHWITKL